MKQILKDIVCYSKDCQSVIVNCTVSKIGPQLRFIFIADVLDYLYNSKALNESLFSEYITVQLYFFLEWSGCPNIVLNLVHNNVCGMFHLQFMYTYILYICM